MKIEQSWPSMHRILCVTCRCIFFLFSFIALSPHMCLFFFLQMHMHNLKTYERLPRHNVYEGKVKVTRKEGWEGM